MTRLPALIVNFYGGPASGKTTAAARLFVALKERGTDAEMHDEQARQCIQQGQLGALDVQPYLFGLQLYKLRTTVGRTDVVIMDSPILLNPVYDKAQSPALRALVLEEYHRFRNLNVVIDRSSTAPHSMVGRVHDRHESTMLDERIVHFLEEQGVPFERMPQGSPADDLADRVVAMISRARHDADPSFLDGIGA